MAIVQLPDGTLKQFKTNCGHTFIPMYLKYICIKCHRELPLIP